MDRMFTGYKGCKLVGWLRTSTVGDLKFKMPSITVIIVNEDSSSRHSLWVLKNDLRILVAVAERTSCSQTPPIWLAKGGILCQLNQSPHCSCKKECFLQFWFSKNEITAIIWVDWSDISCHATNLWRAGIKEFVSKQQVTSMCTALLAMHLNIAPYCLTMLLLCLTVKDLNMSNCSG